MRYVICPDSFKGSLTADEAAQAMRRGVLDADPEASVKVIPLADGGEGTAEILGHALGGMKVSCRTLDAMLNPVTADYYIIGGDTAVMDVASSIGLALIKASGRPLHIMSASSRGVGLVVDDAWQRGIRNFVIGLGGSATCDGGRGMYEAMKGIINAHECEFTILCDVDNPLYGPEGAAYMFAPQKGADPQQVRELDIRLRRQCREMERSSGRNAALCAGAGAAGGIGAMMAAMFNARLERGIEYVMRILDMDRAFREADIVLTGEGCIDTQTLHGKTLSGVLTHAGNAGVPVMAFAGCLRHEETLKGKFAALHAITPHEMTLADAMRPETAASNLRKTVADSLNGFIPSQINIASHAAH